MKVRFPEADEPTWAVFSRMRVSEDGAKIQAWLNKHLADLRSKIQIEGSEKEIYRLQGAINAVESLVAAMTAPPESQRRQPEQTRTSR